MAKCHDVEVMLEQRAARARHTGGRGGRNREWLRRSQGMVVVVMGSASGTAAAGGRKEARKGAMEDNGATRGRVVESKAMAAMAIKGRGGWGREEPVVREGHGKEGRRGLQTLICSR
jgi:hypothetical protein